MWFRKKTWGHVEDKKHTCKLSPCCLFLSQVRVINRMLSPAAQLRDAKNKLQTIECQLKKKDHSNVSKQQCSQDVCTFSDTCSPVCLMQLILQVHQTVSGLWEQKGVFHQKLPPERSPAQLRVSPQLTLLAWKGLKEVNTSRNYPLGGISSVLFPFRKLQI